MTRIHEVQQAGQAIWYDSIRRALLDYGELQRLIDAGVSGVTSNPTIFERAMFGSTDYDTELRNSDKSITPTDIYEQLFISDIQRTADLLRPVYERTSGNDGYVSLEVSPDLAHNTQGTVAEARRLYDAVGRPNVMIKIPATAAGIDAIAQTIAAGIPVNATLIFSVAQYEPVANAYMQGLEGLAAQGGDLNQIASVASFAISRIDTAVDRLLQQQRQNDLQGKIAIAQAKVAYARFQELLQSERWQQLAAQGGRVQRLLWTSTGCKNPHYADTLYVDALIDSDTVNTLPPVTLGAFELRGSVAPTLTSGLAEAQQQLAALANSGIDLMAITEQLQRDEVNVLAESFAALLTGIAQKRERLLANKRSYHGSLGQYQQQVDSVLANLRDEAIIRRIWAHEHTVWKPEPTEITNRLGWLHMPDMMPEALPEIHALVEEVRAASYTHALLLGMGGSSLAPEVFRLTFGVKPGYLDLAVLDSTDPGTVLSYADQLDLARTLFIVSTKSGGTVETFSFFKYFYNRVAETLGADQAGAHFVAITDPGSGLVDTARTYNFRKPFSMTRPLAVVSPHCRSLASYPPPSSA
ncbi:MAG: transaldolase [Chloroflexaceae bacterium]|nr:transaldolase [Chloroflexaceae bacterium]